jgi:predicted Holliday junction resolvase-like endonuclease
MFAEELPPISPTSHSTEANFIGAPIGFLVFRGMQDIEETIFVKVKSGSAHLNVRTSWRTSVSSIATVNRRARIGLRCKTIRVRPKK